MKKFNRNKKINKMFTAIALLLLATLLFTACSGGGNGGSVTNDVQGTEAVTETTAQASDNAAEGNVTIEDMSDEEAAAESLTFSDFTTEDLEGNEVTKDIFKDHDYTMINYWGTYCGPCISEMPELEKLSKELPDNVQLIGITIDYPYGSENEKVKDAADLIVNETGVTYKNLKVWQDSYEILAALSYGIPTTVFVDSEGNVIGDPVIGPDLLAYRERISELIKG